MPEFDDLEVTHSAIILQKNGWSTDINGIILPRIQRIARMSWMDILPQDAGASGEKELVIGRIFQTIEGDEKHGALQLRGMHRWRTSHYEMSLTFCN